MYASTAKLSLYRVINNIQEEKNERHTFLGFFFVCIFKKWNIVLSRIKIHFSVSLSVITLQKNSPMNSNYEFLGQKMGLYNQYSNI